MMNPPLGLGENMAWSSVSSGYSMSDGTKAWQSEDVYYDFSNHQECTAGSCPSCSKGPNKSWYDCGHFTQNIWKSTKFVCVAKATNEAGTFIVARYENGGNMQGAYLANVDGNGPKNGQFVGKQ